MPHASTMLHIVFLFGTGADGKCKTIKFHGDKEKATKEADAWLRKEKANLGIK